MLQLNLYAHLSSLNFSFCAPLKTSDYKMKLKAIKNWPNGPVLNLDKKSRGEVILQYRKLAYQAQRYLIQ